MERNDRTQTTATPGTRAGYEPPRVETIKTSDDLARESLMGAITPDQQQP